MFSDLPSGCLSDIISLEILCGRGPAGNTLMLSLLFGLSPAVGVQGDFDLEFTVRFRRGTL